MNGASKIYRSRPGAVLLLVLLVIVVLAPLLVGAAHRAINEDATSKELHRDLQHRWAQVSIADAVISSDPYGEGAEVPGRFTFTVMLGDLECNTVVSDEQAKANLNTLLDRVSVNRIQTNLRRITDSGSSLRIRPLAGRDLTTKLVTYAQVFAENDPSKLFGQGEGSGLCDHFTLWGDGRLNVTRAIPDAAKLYLSDLLDGEHISALLESSGPGKDAPVAQLLREAGADADSIEEAISHMTQDSGAVGVLVRTQMPGSGPRHRWTVEWTESNESEGGSAEGESNTPEDTGPHRRVILW